MDGTFPSSFLSYLLTDQAYAATIISFDDGRLTELGGQKIRQTP